MEKNSCDLCGLMFHEARWCRCTNCPTTEKREPSDWEKSKLNWNGKDAIPHGSKFYRKDTK